MSVLCSIESTNKSITLTNKSESEFLSEHGMDAESVSECDGSNFNLGMSLLLNPRTRAFGEKCVMHAADCEYIPAIVEIGTWCDGAYGYYSYNFTFDYDLAARWYMKAFNMSADIFNKAKKEGKLEPPRDIIRHKYTDFKGYVIDLMYFADIGDFESASTIVMLLAGDYAPLMSSDAFLDYIVANKLHSKLSAEALASMIAAIRQRVLYEALLSKTLDARNAARRDATV